MLEQIVSVFLLLIFGVFIYLLFRSLYYRYLKVYDEFFINYFKGKGYKYIKNSKPTKNDWLTSPFSKPKSIEISPVSIRVLGLPVSFVEDEYKVLEVEKNEKRFFYWCKLEHQLFSKSRLNIKPKKTEVS